MSAGTVTSIAEAFGKADEELSGGTDEQIEDVASDLETPSLEVENEQAEAAPETDNRDSDEAEQSVFDPELFADDEGADGESAFELDWDMQLEVNGLDEPVTLREMADGYLRQADYTRKTQELAAQRESLGQAEQLWKALNNDPVGLARALAERVGLVEQGAELARPDLELSPFKTPEEVEAEISRRVEEELANHPALKEAQEAQARQTVESELDRIGEKFGVGLSRADRDLIISTAIARQTGDLELVFQALQAEARERAAKREQVKKGAGGRPTSRDVESREPMQIGSVSDAFEAALAELDS